MERNHIPSIGLLEIMSHRPSRVSVVPTDTKQIPNSYKEKSLPAGELEGTALQLPRTTISVSAQSGDRGTESRSHLNAMPKSYVDVVDSHP